MDPVWRRLSAEGAEWEARMVAVAQSLGAGGALLEFRSLDGNRPPRRVAVEPDALSGMTDAALRSAFRQARPIAADVYGRPGKQMTDS